MSEFISEKCSKLGFHEFIHFNGLLFGPIEDVTFIADRNSGVRDKAFSSTRKGCKALMIVHIAKNVFM